MAARTRLPAAGQLAIGDTSIYRDSPDALRTDDALFVYRNAAGFSVLVNNPNAGGTGINVTLGAAGGAALRAQVTGDAG